MLITSLIGQNQAQDLAEQQQANQDVLSQAAMYDYLIQDPSAPLPLKAAAHKGAMDLVEDHGGKDIQDQLPVFGQMLGTLAMGSTIQGLNRQLMAQAQQGDKPSPFAPDATAATGPVAGSPLADPTDLGWTTNATLAGTAPLPPAPDVPYQPNQGQPAPPLPVTPVQEGPPTRRRMLPGGQTEEVPYIPPAAATPAAGVRVASAGATPATLTQGALSPWAPAVSSANLTNVGGYMVPAGTSVPGTTPPPAPGAGATAQPHLSRLHRILQGIGKFGAGLEGYSKWAEQDRIQQQAQANIQRDRAEAAYKRQQLDQAYQQGLISPQEYQESVKALVTGSPSILMEVQKAKAIAQAKMEIEDLAANNQREAAVQRLEGLKPELMKTPEGQDYYERGLFALQTGLPMPTSKSASQTDMTGALRTLYQAYLAQGRTPAEAKKLAGDQYTRQFAAGLGTKELNLEVERQLADISGIPAAATPDVPRAAGTTTVSPAGAAAAGPPQGPIPEKGAPVLDDQDAASVNEFLSRALGLLPSGGRDKFSQLRLRRGEAILMKQTGMSATQLYAAVKLKQDEAKALSTNVQMTAGIETLQQRLQEFGRLLIEARSKVDDSGVPLLNRYLQAGMRNITGDEAIGRLDTAINAVTRTYAQLLSGGYASTAMPHVSSADEAKQTLGAHMKEGTIAGIIDQMGKEADAETATMIGRQQQLFDDIASPLGRPGGGGRRGGAGGGGGTAGGGAAGGGANVVEWERGPDGKPRPKQE